MILIVIILLAVCVGLPLFYAWRVWRLDEPTIAGWLLAVGDACVFVAVIMLVGRWDIAGYYLRFALLALLASAIAVSFFRHIQRPFAPPDRTAFFKKRLATMLSLGAFSAALIYILGGTIPPERTRDFAFPLRDGRFTIAQGGGVTLLNYHAGHQAQRFAADISAIGLTGFRASGILPDDPERYEIFGKPVVSPCVGTVIQVVDGLPDLAPPKRDRENPAGNHVALLCNGLRVELAHFQRGSVRTEPGMDVRTGDLIGLVGNSGNTTEPHLHMHATDPATGAGVAITFGDRFPVRNRAFGF